MDAIYITISESPSPPPSPLRRQQWIALPVRAARLADVDGIAQDAPFRRPFPADVLDLIARQCDVQTLSRLSQTSSAGLDWFGPILLRHAVLSPDVFHNDAQRYKLNSFFYPRLKKIVLSPSVAHGLSLVHVQTLELSAQWINYNPSKRLRPSAARLRPSDQSTLNLKTLTIRMDVPGLNHSSYRQHIFQPSFPILNYLNPETVRFAHTALFLSPAQQQRRSRVVLENRHFQPRHRPPPQPQLPGFRPESHRMNRNEAWLIRTSWTRMRTLVLDHVDLTTGEMERDTTVDESEDVSIMLDVVGSPLKPGRAATREWTLKIDISKFERGPPIRLYAWEDDDEDDEDDEVQAGDAPSVGEVTLKEMRKVEKRLRVRDVGLLEGRNMRVVVVVPTEERKTEFEGWLDAPGWATHRDLVTVEVAS